MITILKQFHQALIATMVAYRQKTTSSSAEIKTLTRQLKEVSAERDLLLAEQEEALLMIDEMTVELDKK